ncbi:MAG: DUF4013 domain-containing protein [Methanothermobacter sp.]
MNLKEILSDSFRYPISNLNRLFSLGILLFFSVLIIPAIFANGYMLRVMEYSFNGSNELPPFNDWLNMFVDGLKYAIVMLVYYLIPGLFIGFLTVIILISMVSYSAPVMDFNALFGSYIMILIIVGLVVMALPYIFSQMALPHVVKEGKLDVLLELRNLLDVIKKIGWVKYLLALIVLTLFSLLVTGLNLIPRLLHTGDLVIYLFSAIISFFIGSYLLAFQGRLLALLYQDGIEEK